MECKFTVGQKIVCIKELTYKGYWESVEVGKTYTIRELHPGVLMRTGQETICVLLQEIYNAMGDFDLVEPGYCFTLFRPVEPDISVFTKALEVDHTVKQRKYLKELDHLEKVKALKDEVLELYRRYAMIQDASLRGAKKRAGMVGS